MYKSINEFLNILGKKGYYIVLLIFRSPYEAFSTILNATFLGLVFSAVLSKDLLQLYKVLGFFSIGVVALYLYNGSVWTVFAAFIARQTAVLRGKLYRHVSSLPMETIDSRSNGEWFSRMNSDVKSSLALMSEPHNLPFLVVSITGLVVSLVMLYLGEPRMTVLVLLFVIPHAIIGQFVIAKPMNKLSINVQQLTAENTSKLHMMVECSVTARVYQSEEWLLKKFEENSLALRRAAMRVQLQGAMGRATLSIMGLGGYLVVLIAGSRWIEQGSLDFPTLVALFQYRGGVMKTAMMLLNTVMTLQITIVGVDRVLEVMHLSRK